MLEYEVYRRLENAFDFTRNLFTVSSKVQVHFKSMSYILKLS